MSYYKITAVAPETTNKIRFYYGVDSILNRVEKVSSYKATTVVKENGQADFDRIQSSNDEKELMLEYMQECMLEIFDLFFHVIAGDSISHNTGLVLTGAATVNAGSFLIGNAYTIKAVGTTDFTLIGASAKTIGVSFIATGAGSGTGTAENAIYATYCDFKDNAKYRTINLDLIDTKISNATVDFLLSKWYILKGLVEDAKIHMAEYQKGLADISKRSLALRQLY